MFYIIITPSIVFLLFSFRYFYNLRKHDKILYRLCEIRRDLISFLRKEEMSIDRDSYISTKRLLVSLNATIHYYDNMKTTLFNLKKLKKYIKQYKKELDLIEKFDPSNPKIQEFYRRFIFTIISAFFYFTPFLRSEIFFRIIIRLVSMLGYSKDNITTLRKIENKAQELGIFRFKQLRFSN